VADWDDVRRLPPSLSETELARVGRSALGDLRAPKSPAAAYSNGHRAS
jgi:hypothetical protein